MSSPPTVGTPDGVAVARDAAHDALDQPALPGVVGRAEEEGVHHGQRPGAHGEDVAQDAAHAGGGALVGLDGRRVVVALDADGHGDAVAGVDDPGVLARADQDPRALGRQAPQVQPGRLVRAVLAPHHGVEGQLEVVGGPAQDLADGLELVVGQAQRPVQRLLGRWLVGRQRLGRRSHGALHDRGPHPLSGAGRGGLTLSGADRRARRRDRARTTPWRPRIRPPPASAAGRPGWRAGRGRR